MEGGIAAPMAGKLFADLGATVVKVEPPGGEPGRRAWPLITRPLKTWPLKPDAEAGNGGEPVSGAFLHLNSNKRSLVLDLDTSPGREALEELVGAADLLLHDVHPTRMKEWGLDYERLSSLHPRLVMVSITPFGLDGPYAQFAGAELPLIHGSGLAWLTPDRSPPPDWPPIRPLGRHALMQAGIHAAIAGLAACHHAKSGGPGEHVEISVLEVSLNLLCRHFVSYTYAGEEESRLGKNLTSPATIFACRDGAVYLIVVEQDQWERLVDLMGNPSWTRGEAFSSTIHRGVPKTMAIIEREVGKWAAGWEVEALFHACQERRIGCAPVYSPADLEDEPHLHERGFFRSLHHPGLGAVKLPGPPYKLERDWWALRSPAPALGEANCEGDGPALFGDARPAEVRREVSGKNSVEISVEIPVEIPGQPRRPLEGVRVLDLTWVWAGPYTTQMLAFLGAEVIKVESSRRPDLARRLNLFAQGMEPGPNRNGYFNQIGQSKYSAAINLAHPEGLRQVKEIAARSDIVLSNFATGVMERLGLGPEVLRECKEDLIVANLSAYGQTGPYRHYLGYGPAIFPLAGSSALTGYEEDGQPQNMRIAYADPNAGAYLAFAILAALEVKRQGGGGQTIDIALWEAFICTGFEGWMAHALGAEPPAPMGNHDPRFAPHNLYRCRGAGSDDEDGGEYGGGVKDGGDDWVAIAVTGQKQWRALCDVAGKPAWTDDPRFATAELRKARESQLDAWLCEWCRGQDKWDVTRKLQAAGVPAFPALSAKELSGNEHLLERGFLALSDTPEAGKRLHTGVPWRMRNRPNGVPFRAPLLGEHTDSVLKTVLGLDRAEIARLRDAGAIE